MTDKRNLRVPRKPSRYQVVLSNEACASSLSAPGGRSPVVNFSRRSGACESAVRGGRGFRGVTTAAERNEGLATF